MRRSPFRGMSLVAAIALSACTSSQDVLEPSAITVESSTASVSTPAPPLTAEVAARTRLRFDPIVGTTVETAAPLTERLAAQARARGIGIAGSADPSTTHVMKGYFSVISEGRGKTVIYVWDVYDPSGNRLHRINGQQKAASSRGDGWSGVSAVTMQAIADTTIDQLAAWLAGTTG